MRDRLLGEPRGARPRRRARRRRAHPGLDLRRARNRADGDGHDDGQRAHAGARRRGRLHARRACSASATSSAACASTWSSTGCSRATGHAGVRRHDGDRGTRGARRCARAAPASARERRGRICRRLSRGPRSRDGCRGCEVGPRRGAGAHERGCAAARRPRRESGSSSRSATPPRGEFLGCHVAAAGRPRTRALRAWLLACAAGARQGPARRRDQRWCWTGRSASSAC